MSYPKRPPATKTDTASVQQKQQKRDQLKNLIVTKLKNKYASQNPPADFEDTIRREVDYLLTHEQPTEANLLKLDKKLQKMLLNPEEAPKETRELSSRQSAP